MARFVMANRRAGKFHESLKGASRAALDTSFASAFAGHVDVIGDTAPPSDQERRIVVFDADPGEVAARAPLMPADVIVEPEILHYPATALPLDVAGIERGALAEPWVAGSGLSLTVTIQAAGTPLQGAEVILVLRGLGGLRKRLEAITPATGQVSFQFSLFWSPAALVVEPAGRFWGVLVRQPQDQMVVEVPLLPVTGPIEWWHRVLGVGQYVETRGAGIRIGVADTGVGPHQHLSHVASIGAFIDGNYDPSPAVGSDVDSHGSHVCGTIAARPSAENGGFAGVAPGVYLASARVFPPGQGANQGDIANAIDHLSKQASVDLINLSLGSEMPSQIERDAIIDALERGTLCICAAANSAGPVEYPAQFPECVAVSALGLEGWGPAGTLASGRHPTDPNRYGIEHLYLANFSCFGPEIACAAPGVGIIATVPERHGLLAPYGAKDGTSMASPAACGVLATILAAAPDYQSLPRDLTRSHKARALLSAACRDIGLAAEFQGRGVPQVP